jgi:hypothetical protein
MKIFFFTEVLPTPVKGYFDDDSRRSAMTLNSTNCKC